MLYQKSARQSQSIRFHLFTPVDDLVERFVFLGDVYCHYHTFHSLSVWLDESVGANVSVPGHWLPDCWSC